MNNTHKAYKAPSTKRSAVTKGGTWAGIGAALAQVGTMVPGNWGLGVSALGILVAGLGGPIASHVDAAKANAAAGHG